MKKKLIEYAVQLIIFAFSAGGVYMTWKNDHEVLTRLNKEVWLHHDVLVEQGLITVGPRNQ